MDRVLFHEAFAQARLKVYRADRHFQEAQAVFRQYAAGDFYELVDDRDPETFKQSIRLRAAPIEAHLPLSVGDCFHCLSAALEYVMSGLMKAKTGNPTRIHFPTQDSRKAFRDSFKRPKANKGPSERRRIMEAFPALVFDLLTVIQPYPGGDFGLWEIRKADNIDKHNLIIPSVTVAELVGVGLADKVNNNVFHDLTLGVGAGGVLNAIAYQNGGSYLEITNKGHASLSVRFADDMEVFAGKPVFPTLLECVQLTAKAIDVIEDSARRYL